MYTFMEWLEARSEGGYNRYGQPYYAKSVKGSDAGELPNLGNYDRVNGHELMAAWRAGGAERERVFNIMVPRILNHARIYANQRKIDHNDIRDGIQHAMLSLLRGTYNPDIQPDLIAWITRVATNYLIDQYHKNKRWKAGVDEEMPMPDRGAGESERTRKREFLSAVINNTPGVDADSKWLLNKYLETGLKFGKLVELYAKEGGIENNQALLLRLWRKYQKAMETIRAAHMGEQPRKLRGERGDQRKYRPPT